MEDLMLIRSSFMRRIISLAINKAIAKQKYGITVNLDDIRDALNWLASKKYAYN